MIQLTTLSHDTGVHFAQKTSHVFEMYSNSLLLVVRVTVIHIWDRVEEKRSQMNEN